MEFECIMLNKSDRERKILLFLLHVEFFKKRKTDGKEDEELPSWVSGNKSDWYP